MPAFSQRSKKNLATCHPDLQRLFNEVIKVFDCTVLEGHRDKAAQDAAFASGHSKLKYPQGKHNSIPSLAVDVCPHPLDWSDIKTFHWFAGYVLGVANQLYENGQMDHKIRWGGDWAVNYDLNDVNGLNDLVHFEIIVQ